MARRPTGLAAGTPFNFDDLSEADAIKAGLSDVYQARREFLAKEAERIKRELEAARKSILDRALPESAIGSWLSSSRAILDQAVRRRIALERYSRTQVNKLWWFLDAMKADIDEKLAAGLTGTTAASRAAQLRLRKEVEGLSAEVMSLLNAQLRRDMVGVAGSEGVWVDTLLKDMQAKSGGALVSFQGQRLTATAAMEAALARPMQGALLVDWLADLDANVRKRLDTSLAISFLEGESLSSARRRLSGAVDISKRGLEALVRTSNGHIAASVAEATYQANADLIQGIEWVSTLDSRTTDICRARDGKRWPVGEGPRPPAHPNCRSTTIPVLIGQESPVRETYPEWLKRQPASVQDSILGPTRGKLFRDGKVTVESFVDSTGRRVPLSRLRQ